jgi:hypothetical protein
MWPPLPVSGYRGEPQQGSRLLVAFHYHPRPRQVPHDAFVQLAELGLGQAADLTQFDRASFYGLQLVGPGIPYRDLDVLRC